MSRDWSYDLDTVYLFCTFLRGLSQKQVWLLWFLAHLSLLLLGCWIASRYFL